VTKLNRARGVLQPTPMATPADASFYSEQRPALACCAQSWLVESNVTDDWDHMWQPWGEQWPALPPQRFVPALESEDLTSDADQTLPTSSAHRAFQWDRIGPISFGSGDSIRPSRTYNRVCVCVCVRARARACIALHCADWTTHSPPTPSSCSSSATSACHPPC
jgi:hypothetical protein